ncbi:hypothetical protein QLX08_000817 [Tetragonisca angustula]|uniref:Uncharacterized protein n=1 Tax=Tetragonisca angustula TaxID=166442 RepID=A0AAW1AKL8_9HYME
MEIVIENPVESPPPPPPPPPPPLQPLTISPWNAVVTASQTTFSSSNVVACTSMPVTTTVMTITIAENPTATPSYPVPPVRFSYRETYTAANSLPYAGDPYSAMRRNQHPRGRSYDDSDGTSPTIRRIDKSGLLGITESDASFLKGGMRSPRFLSGMNTVASGMLSPRRFECVGQLDPVPEIPGQTSRANVTPGAANTFPVTSTANLPLISITSPMTGQERRDAASRLDTCETLSVANLAKPMKSTSFDSLESRHKIDRSDARATLKAFNRDLEGIESSNSHVSRYVSSFQLQENCEARARTLGRLSKLALARNDRDGTATAESPDRYSETCCNFPFTVRAVTAFSGFEGTSSLPTTRVTTTTVTTSTTTVAVSAMGKTDTNAKQENVEECNNRAPEEIRAEAEGCEHGPSRNPLIDGESSQKADEFVDNDGIQTLRVIILSEQL